jgi:hypothetical protein
MKLYTIGFAQKRAEVFFEMACTPSQTTSRGAPWLTLHLTRDNIVSSN